MRNSKILVINLSGVANEVVKNIVLAGIGSLTILDNTVVSTKDLGAQFFIQREDVGKNRCEAAQYRIQRLNPRVALTVNTQRLGEVEKSWISQFDVVIATELSYEDLVYVNRITRDAGKYFFASGLFGFYGYVFADLLEHQFQM